VLAKVHSCAIVGLGGAIVEVEVDTSRGLPSFVIVGLPDAAAQEGRERVQAAIKSAGLEFRRHRLTVNLAPASLRKEGPAYHLPIALGELSLDGSVRHVRGVLPMAALARQESFERVLVPVEDAREAALVRRAMTQLQLSARAFHRILKLARTIGDLAGDDQIATAHPAEALQYRPRRWA
jgi:magnesium chelatase family protein